VTDYGFQISDYVVAFSLIGEAHFIRLC